MPVDNNHVDDFLSRATSLPLLDVRSPAEYEKGHIPGALSFPLFTDAERAIIGTIYKQEGKMDAVKKGLQIVGPKMESFVTMADSLGQRSLALYCWRGGMRSDSMAWLLKTCGFQITLLHGGYKTYRNHLMSFFEQKLPLKVVTGFTGSKKTTFLHLLAQRGEQVIDLEGLAQHQGSSFGNQKCTGQPTTEQFQNLVFDSFRTMDLGRTIWIEDESMRIGWVNLVESLYNQKNRSPHIFIEVPKDQRIHYLLEDFGDLTDQQLIDATHAIRKKLGYDKAAQAINFLQTGERKEAAEIILTYYDKQYRKSIADKGQLIQDHYKIDLDELESLATMLTKKKIHAI